MSALVQDDYAPAAATRTSPSRRGRPHKRLAIALVGCAVMALSGTGLANYLGTSVFTGQSLVSADAAPQN